MDRRLLRRGGISLGLGMPIFNVLGQITNFGHNIKIVILLNAQTLRRVSIACVRVGIFGVLDLRKYPSEI